ncbi:MAG: BTAD domain-containing putative transcriptional regulator [Anaerolineae bacterium]|nr:BTAD domain-containing putative transcriptional regulator [Anaerolineae bacterium]
MEPIAENKHLPYLVLDECDRATPSALDEIIRLMLDELPSTKICILTRYLPPTIINDVSVRAVTQVIPIDTGLRLSDFTKIEARPQLDVHAFGQGRAWVNGQEITNWRGALPRNLFFYMIDNPIITRDAIFREFWPCMPENTATNVFFVTRKTVHDALGFDLIESSNRFYRLTDNVAVTYDVNNFHELSQNGALELDDAQLMTANQLFKNTFLQGSDMPWIQARREELEFQYLVMLRSLAKLKQDSGDLETALNLNIRVLAKNWSDENVAEKIMDIYLKRNQPCEAVKVFDQIEEFLQGLGLNPQKTLQNLGDTARSRCI